MRLRDYILRRLLLLPPVLLGLSVLTFTLSHAIGDPVAVYVTEKTPEWAIEKIVKAHHLDEPWHIQYVYYLLDLARGDWGYSRSAYNLPVTDVIKLFFPATLELTIVATLLSLTIGIPLGILSATKKDTLIDHASRLFAISGVSMPIFWLGLLMQYAFFYGLRSSGLPGLPSGGRVGPTTIHPPYITGMYLVDSLITVDFDTFMDALVHILMPALVLAYHSTGIVSRMMRASMLEVMSQDYITLARAKGLREQVVIYRHALRNAMIPTLTVSGLAFGGLLAGAPLTEIIFSWPGLGRWAVFAIQTTDFAGIMGFTIVVGVIYITVNLVVDVLYAFFDPRVRLA